MFVARTDVDPINRGAGRPSRAALSAYHLHDKMRDAYGSYTVTGPLQRESWRRMCDVEGLFLVSPSTPGDANIKYLGVISQVVYIAD